MKQMFLNAISFNSDISQWDMSSVRTMYQMFNGAKLFNSDISKWVTSRVTSMMAMFKDTKVFNSDVSKWITSSVEDMEQSTYLLSLISLKYILSCCFVFCRTCTANKKSLKTYVFMSFPLRRICFFRFL
jgi:surface protein